MKKPIILGALAVGAFVAAIIYFKHDSANPPASTIQAASDGSARTEPAADGARSRNSGGKPSGTAHAAPSQVAPDPRLAALGVSPDNDLIQFVRGADDRVIAEIDKDPSSPSFQKPLREYMYSDGRVVGATSYRYFPDRVEVSRTAVSYKPDGSVDKFSESTSYVDARVMPKRGS